MQSKNRSSQKSSSSVSNRKIFDVPDELVLLNESMENLRKKFLKWKEAFETKGLKVNLNKTKIMVSVERKNTQEQKSIHEQRAARG